MRGLILAAGRGSRMGVRGQMQPKCLTPLAGRTLLDWQLDAFAEAGIDDVALVTGYKHEALAGRGARQFHNAQWAETNMVSSLFTAREWLLDGPCVVSYGDIVYDTRALVDLVAPAAPIAITYHTRWRELWEARFADPLDDAECLRLACDGTIAAIGGRAQTLAEIEGQYMGLLYLSTGGAMELECCVRGMSRERASKVDMTSLLATAIASGTRIVGVPFDGKFCEVDTVGDAALYERMNWVPQIVASHPSGAAI